MKKKNWLNIKKYPHLVLPHTLEDIPMILEYVKDPIKIARHGFLPFIRIEKKTRKFRKITKKNGSRTDYRVPSEKIRNLYYPANLDSNIYGYYADKLNEFYNKALEANSLSDCITGYRKVLHESGKRAKNNIDFANDVFNHIRSQNPNEVSAIALDISSYFDNLNHQIIKKGWINLLNLNCPLTLKELPSDHYAVFKNITKFSFVNQKELFKLFQDEIIVERKNGNRKKYVSNLEYLKSERAIAFCEGKDLKYIRNKGLIKSNKWVGKGKQRVLRDFGIPQGSPISSVISNFYLLEFDKFVNDIVSSYGGIYRRYSDDLIVIVPTINEEEIIDEIYSEIGKYKLKIQKTKTQVFRFKEVDGNYLCNEVNRNSKELQGNTKLEYLGFSFDGQTTLIKSSSLAKYYRKMKRSIKKSHYISPRMRSKTKNKIFLRRLKKRFTHLGSNRKRIYKRDKYDFSKYSITKKTDWGNFITYAKMAERVMDNNGIKKQISNHWNIFHDLTAVLGLEHRITQVAGNQSVAPWK